MTAQVMLYPVFIALVTSFLLIALPRSELRLLIPYGLVLGGLHDYLFSLVFGDLLGFFEFTSPGLFDASGYLVLAPLAWSLVVIFFLYFFPKEHDYLGYLYILAWALMATGYSQVVEHVGLFTYRPWFYPLPLLILAILRFALVAWLAKPWIRPR